MIEKCPQCGSQSFIKTRKNNELSENSNSISVEPGGSVSLGFFLGFFLGALGFLLSLICGQKENGKTVMGVLYGVIVNAVIIFIMILSAL